MNIELTGPVTLTLQPQTVVVMIKALHELPYKEAAGPIADLTAQLAPKAPVPAEPAKAK